MKKIKCFLFLFLFASQLSAQIVFENAEQASSFAIANSSNHRLQRLNAISSLNAANLSIQEFLPKFDVSWSEADNIKFGGADSRNKNLNMNMQLPLFDAGKKYLSYKMNQAEKRGNLYNVDIETKNFKSSVISQYYSCLLSEKMLSIKQNLERNSRQQLKIMEREKDLGFTLENDYLEYLISYRKIQDSVKVAGRNLRTQFRIFKVLVGLEPEAEVILSEDISEQDDYIYLEPYSENLWRLLKLKSPELRKQETSFYYAKLKNRQNKLLFVPEISLQGGISFSGVDYPLNNPTYSAKLVFSFSNNPFLPATISSDLGFNNKGKLTGSTNTVSSNVVPQVNYKSTVDVQNIELRQRKQAMKDSVNSLYESLFEQIASYDDCIDNIKRTEETIKLQEKRLAISELQVEKGTMKRIDYLDQLVELAEQKTSLLESIISFYELTRTFEIELDIPFGGLKTCLGIKE